jgi:hypothetical protein
MSLETADFHEKKSKIRFEQHWSNKNRAISDLSVLSISKKSKHFIAVFIVASYRPEHIDLTHTHTVDYCMVGCEEGDHLTDVQSSQL